MNLKSISSMLYILLIMTNKFDYEKVVLSVMKRQNIKTPSHGLLNKETIICLKLIIIIKKNRNNFL